MVLANRLEFARTFKVLVVQKLKNDKQNEMASCNIGQHLRVITAVKHL